MAAVDGTRKDGPEGLSASEMDVMRRASELLRQMTEAGETERLQHELRTRLAECGWRERVRERCEGNTPIVARRFGPRSLISRCRERRNHPRARRRAHDGRAAGRRDITAGLR